MDFSHWERHIQMNRMKFWNMDFKIKHIWLQLAAVVTDQPSSLSLKYEDLQVYFLWQYV